VPTLDYPSQHIQAIGLLLARVGPTLIGDPASSAHIGPRRYVWRQVQSPLGGPKHNGTPHHVGSAQLSFAVECWGHSPDDCWWMVCALLTAIRVVMKGRNYLAPSLTPTRQQLVHEGAVWTVAVQLLFDLPAVDLDSPPGAPSPPPAGSLDGTPTPDTTPAYGETGETTAVVGAVAEATPATSTSGDGQLEGTEP
jgi:hypothetical protein